MALLPLSVLLGLLLGLLGGGRLRALTNMCLVRLPLVVAALAIQVLLGLASSGRPVAAFVRILAVVGSELLVGGWVLSNIKGRTRCERLALALVGTGWLANLMAILCSGGMPVSLSGLRAAGLGHLDVARGHLGKHVPMIATTRLAVLGDWIPVRAIGAVVSPGDLVMAIGLAGFVAGVMHVGEGGPVRCQGST
ncbi:MAG: DUF5317 family protein [Acidimicrobiales bacterium]